MMLFPESPFFLHDGFQHRRPLEKLRRKKRPNPSLRRPSEAPGFCVKRKANDVAQKKRKKAAGLRKHQNLSGSYGIEPSQASGSFPSQNHGTAGLCTFFREKEVKPGRLYARNTRRKNKPPLRGKAFQSGNLSAFQTHPRLSASELQRNYRERERRSPSTSSRKEASSPIISSTLRTAWMTVVWSRSNLRPISGSERGVSVFDRNIAT